MSKVELAYEIIARDRNATRTFDKVGDASDRAGRAGSKFGKIMGGAVVAGAAAAAAGIGILAYKTVGWIKDAEESAKISRITEAAIKSTGGAANITADQIGKLAESLSNKTAIDDEAIQSAQNMLLSFTNIRNEVGAGNDIFNQASAAVLDYSTRTGTDATAASVTLGKALNDPIKGLTALGKAGVQFTEQQKEQIKTLVESGDVLGAQKIILAELTTQFGGSAEAAAGPMDRLRTIVDNLGERVGTALLPSIESLANYLISDGIPAFERLATWVGENKDEIIDFGASAATAGLIAAEGFLRLVQGVATGAATGVQAMSLLATAGYGMARDLLGAFEAALGWLPVFRGKFAEANAILTAFEAVGKRRADSVTESLRGVAAGAGAAAGAAANLRDKIAQIQSKRVTITVDYNQNLGGLSPRAADRIAGRAVGGPVRAGTPYWVGERGPELLIPEQNGRVLTAEQSRQATTPGAIGGDGAAAPQVIVLQLDGREVARVVNDANLSNRRR